MAKIIYTFPDSYSEKILELKQVSVILFLSAVLIAATGQYNTGLYELIYGAADCIISPALITAATAVSPPYIIAIDPGHGGTDTGAQAIAEEYQVIDNTAACLYDLLQLDPNFIPVLTRTDQDPESGPRADTANNAGACLLISLHANSDSHRSTKGFECFPQPPGRTWHNESVKFARLIVEQMRAAGHNIRGGEEKTGIRYAYYYGNTKKIVDSSDNKVRSRKSFGILEKTHCPAVLVEQCFISNQYDVENWATEEGCRKAAQLYYNAIKQYFGVD